MQTAKESYEGRPPEDEPVVGLTLSDIERFGRECRFYVMSRKAITENSVMSACGFSKGCQVSGCMLNSYR